MILLNAVLWALAVVNVGLTLYHWRLLHRARAYERETHARLLESVRLVADARALFEGRPATLSNGRRPALPLEDVD